MLCVIPTLTLSFCVIVLTSAEISSRVSALDASTAAVASDFATSSAWAFLYPDTPYTMQQNNTQ
jgi:hypothetical protein